MPSANIKDFPILDEQEHLVGTLTLVDILHTCADDILAIAPLCFRRQKPMRESSPATSH